MITAYTEIAACQVIFQTCLLYLPKPDPPITIMPRTLNWCFESIKAFLICSSTRKHLTKPFTQLFPISKQTFYSVPQKQLKYQICHVEPAGSKQQYLAKVFILTFIPAFKHRYFTQESALLGRADRHRRNNQMKLLIPRARQAVGRCLADQQVSKCSWCSLCFKDLNYTEISAWSVADVQDVLLTLSGQVCYQNKRKVLGLKEHLDTESCLKEISLQPGVSYLLNHTEIRRQKGTSQTPTAAESCSSGRGHTKSLSVEPWQSTHLLPPP